MWLKKLSTLLFLLGIGIAVLSGTFSIPADMVMAKVVFLFIAGTLVGLINISEDEEFGFLVCATAFIVATSAVLPLVEASFVWINLSNILHNMILFFAPAAIVSALKLMIGYVADLEPGENAVIDFMSTKEKAWNILILIAVNVTIVTLLLTLFFNVQKYAQTIIIIDYAVLAIFLVDLVVLYKKADGFGDFIKKDWLDIVACIPFGMAFQLTKIVRLIRILRVFSKTEQIGKVVKTGMLTRAGKLARAERFTRSSKYFSDDSGFNEVLEPKGKKKR